MRFPPLRLAFWTWRYAPVRVVIAALGLVACSLLLALTLPFASGLGRLIDDLLREQAVDAITCTATEAAAGRLGSHRVEEIRAMPGVRAVVPVVRTLVGVEAGSRPLDYLFARSLVGDDPLLESVPLVAGRRPRHAWAAEVVFPVDIVQRLGLPGRAAVGSQVLLALRRSDADGREEILRRPVTIAGLVAHSPDGEIYLPFGTLLRVRQWQAFERDGLEPAAGEGSVRAGGAPRGAFAYVSSLAVYAREPSDVAQLVPALEAMGLRADSALYRAQGLLCLKRFSVAVLGGLTAMVALLCGLAIFSSNLLDAVTRRDEARLLRVMGASPGQIQLWFLLPSLALCAACLVFSGVAGGALAGAIDRYLQVAFQWRVFADRWWHMPLIATFLLALTGAAAWLPARYASRIDARRAPGYPSTSTVATSRVSSWSARVTTLRATCSSFAPHPR